MNQGNNPFAPMDGIEKLGQRPAAKVIKGHAIAQCHAH